MYSLETIKKLNAEAAVRAASETETTRHCSYVKSAGGVVLHSAKRRSTLFLDGLIAARFLRMAARNRTPGRRDALIESYFTA